jgi:glycosyltransferase involved in cell wall biosynthesis
MKSPFTVAVTASNGIGGTEKAASLYAVELARRGHRVLFLSHPGLRDRLLAQGNVRLVPPPIDAKTMAEFLRDEQVDVVHQHVPGYPLPSPLYEALRLLGEKRPRLIETTVFGRFEDPAGDEWVDFRCFISKTSALQAYERSRRPLTDESLQRSTVVFYPLPPLDAAGQQRVHRDALRKELGIQPDEIFILRFGRPVKKWNRNEVRVFQKARRKNPLLRMLLMEPPPEIWREVESGRWGEGILLQRALSDFDRLAAIYSAGDLKLHMSDWGESYGYTLAEAMQHSIPVVVTSTPWGDNAQVELVEHGVTGFVCSSIEGAEVALLRLAADPGLRRQFGEAGAKRIDSFSNLVRETDLLEEIIAHVVQGAPLVKILDRNRELMQFKDCFHARERNVLEREDPKLGPAYARMLGYDAYRRLRTAAGQLLRRLRGTSR